MDFEDIYREAVQRAPADQPSTFVELGTYCGRSFAFLAVEILNSGKPIAAWTYDVWADFEEQWSKDLVQAKFRDHIPFTAAIFIRRNDSAVASLNFEDGEVDFAFIDAAHDHASVDLDIRAWWPKIRSGGVMAGHDYWPPDTIPIGAKNPEGFPDVVRAVHEFANREGLTVRRQGTSWVALKP